MHHTGHKSNTYPRGTVVLLFSCLVLLLSCHKDKHDITTAKKPVILVLDAGHGGTDSGGLAPNGITEKDLAMKICTKIAQLAGAYNITVVQTRNGDKNVNGEERTETANKSGGDMLLSVHVNKNTVEGKGYELIASPENVKAAEGKKLASDIMENLSATGIQTKYTEKGVFLFKNITLPSVAIECGDMDDAGDMAVLNNDDQLEFMCRKVLSGMVSYANAR